MSNLTWQEQHIGRKLYIKLVVKGFPTPGGDIERIMHHLPNQVVPPLQVCQQLQTQHLRQHHIHHLRGLVLFLKLFGLAAPKKPGEEEDQSLG